MSREHVDNAEIKEFAKEKVNLPKEKASEYRAQVNRLRDKLEKYVSENPDFSLRKMLLSGSLAKGTALRNINDIDVAAYVSSSKAPESISELVEYLADRLKKAFPNFSPDQITQKTYSVTVSFRNSGLNVDIVPILYEGNPNWYGKLVSQEDGTFLETCIPRHLEFLRKRKDKNPTHYAQIIRLAKYWVKNLKVELDNFRFKSFMVELIFAKLADKGQDFSDYPEALQSFFTYIAKSNLEEQIVFNDYYNPAKVGHLDDPIQIMDPVNSENNATRLYTREQADQIVEVSIDAGDAIDGALRAPTKEKTIYYWQNIFGNTFQI